MKTETKKAIQNWDTLLREFEAVSLVPNLESEFEELLKDLDHIHATWREEQKSCADGFNILKTLRVTRKELCHSDVLAWLLDNRIDGYGTPNENTRQTKHLDDCQLGKTSSVRGCDESNPRKLY